MFLELYVQIQHLCFVAELSSLQISYHHYIAVGSGVAEIVGGLFKAVVKFKRKVGGSSEDVAKVQVSRLTNQKCKKANERRELEDGLLKRIVVDKFISSSCLFFLLHEFGNKATNNKKCLENKNNYCRELFPIQTFSQRKCMNCYKWFARSKDLTQLWWGWWGWVGGRGAHLLVGGVCNGKSVIKNLLPLVVQTKKIKDEKPNAHASKKS